MVGSTIAFSNISKKFICLSNRRFKFAWGGYFFDSNSKGKYFFFRILVKKNIPPPSEFKCPCG